MRFQRVMVSGRAWRVAANMLLPMAVVTMLTLPLMGQQENAPQSDPPSEVARVSVLMGNVSVEPASVDQFSAAQVNDALTTGDRIYADVGANAELETGLLAVRMGQETDLTVTAMTDSLEQFGLAQGSVHLRSFRLQPGTAVELDTPNVAVTVLQPGDVRVDVDPGGGATTVALISGQVQVDGNGYQQVLQAGQGLRLEGSSPVVAQPLDATAGDGLDSFSNDRDAAYESGVQGDDAYVNPDVIGAEDLSANGDWETDTDDGAVWYPTGVAVGWVPYSCGSWTWVAPWGWTWVDCYAWGFAPFHYGRWVHRGNRWGWVPGPPVVRPVYSPAMVAFVGGAGLRSGDAPATAWFALGPHDAYAPWYYASPRYRNRVNAASMQDANADEVRRLYNQPTLDSAFASQGAQGYANRGLATVVVSQSGFAAGRPVRDSLVHVSAESLDAAQVLAHPLVTPQRSMVAGAPARAVPAEMNRPAMASRAVGVAPAPEAAQPQHEAARPATGAETPPAHAPSSTSRPLFHEAVPPQPRPSFDQQQKAMQETDPGRPLEPRQMENLRQNRSAGAPQQREASHPAPAPPPRPAPPPQSPSPKPH